MADIWLTEIENANICGPRITADTFEDAQVIADNYNTTLGRLIVIGKLVCEFENFELN
jgi:hypothetical protein